MLCADGARGGTRQGVRGAIFAYNHAHWYVRDVLALAARYTAAARALGRKACQAVPAPGFTGTERPLGAVGTGVPGRSGGRRSGPEPVSCAGV